MKQSRIFSIAAIGLTAVVLGTLYYIYSLQLAQTGTLTGAAPAPSLPVKVVISPIAKILSLLPGTSNIVRIQDVTDHFDDHYGEIFWVETESGQRGAGLRTQTWIVEPNRLSARLVREIVDEYTHNVASFAEEDLGFAISHDVYDSDHGYHLSRWTDFIDSRGNLVASTEWKSGVSGGPRLTVSDPAGKTAAISLVAKTGCVNPKMVDTKVLVTGLDVNGQTVNLEKPQSVVCHYDGVAGDHLEDIGYPHLSAHGTIGFNTPWVDGPPGVEIKLNDLSAAGVVIHYK